MTGRPAAKDGSVSGACQLGECGHCHGNIDLQCGNGTPVPMLTCSHRCHHGKPHRVERR
ncbi:hypothetical protein JL475_00745 [Streptomyces sp. M2CJ-2]|uniref:hypothetical protein n=1 Tax=Streptomyces sp. M2CJ-2 TaxID=2803948 RepID=UPI00192304EA|nr:hypothetical protein [Streptomyces sp. M2CJ-2]MBL3664575.1 hypothetical protein [Streptomyces sp. M2CJ-2]